MLGGSRASALQRAAGFSSRRGSPFQSASNGSTSAPYATDPTSYATAAPTTSATALQQQQQHPFKRDLSYAAYSLRVDDVRTAIADHLRDRGVVGVFALVRALKRAEFNGEISLARFETVLAEHRLGLARADVALLFNEFDERRRNLVNVDKIVDGLRQTIKL
ncbi:hypothetical protein BC828DRAFT_404295 [Blastocladiella britannica]|nr:hypothetical protein BC828DRAFT_404295 [Blastocladiella britannica]